jgi:capsular polysaccharide biosynthesis protein
MELKEYWKILKEGKQVFWGVVLAVVLAAVFVVVVRPVSYITSLSLNITRSGSQQVDAYKFDDFYRIQADEKFADTLSQWLQSPRTVTEIFTDAGLDSRTMNLRGLEKFFSPEKLSSQLVTVNFSTKTSGDAEKISKAVVRVLSANIEELNKNQKEVAWFALVAHDPVVIKSSISLFLVGISAFFLGIFLAFWMVMIRHYLK